MLRNVGNSAPDEARPQGSPAEALIQEFETSGKGWVWETGREGKLSYSSDSVARNLRLREPAAPPNDPVT